MRKCFAMQGRGEAGSWNCKEWAHKTDTEKLPEFAGASPHASWLEAHYARHGLGAIPQAVGASPRTKAMEGELMAMQRRMALGG